MLLRNSAAVCAAFAAVAVIAMPCPSYAWLEGPEPAFLGLITKDAERDTFAYDLLNDPDLAGPAPAFSTETAHIGLLFPEDEKNSWAYQMLASAAD